MTNKSTELEFERPTKILFLKFPANMASSPSPSKSAEPTRLALAEEFLHLAKVNLSDLCSEIQAVQFAAPLLSDDYRLIELDKQLLDQLEKGETYISSIFFYCLHHYVSLKSGVSRR
jgi:hypothetical protein